MTAEQVKSGITNSIPKKSRGITIRSIILGSILAACHTCWLVYEETALGHLGISFTTCMIVPSVIAILFIIMMWNSLMKRVFRPLMLAPAEMMVIFTMTTMSAVIAGFDLLQNLFPVLLWPRYFGTPMDGYDKFFEYIPSWFLPQNDAVIREFFTGGRDFWQFFHPVIFRAWIVPMLFWGTFLFLLAFTMLCLGSVLRRQWVDREKLTFPIIELPLNMARENTVGSLMSNPLMLLGFGLTAAVMGMNCLSNLHPAVPGINLNVNNIGRTAFVTPPLSGMNPVFVSWWPYAIGLCYLIPLDISFSCWFFYVFIRLACAFGTAQGWREPNAGFSPDQFPYFQNLTYGAWIGMFITVMWSARGQIVQVWKSAMNNEKLPGEENEPMSYRTAFFGAVLGFCALVLITRISGVRPHVALVFFTIYFLAMVVMTRIYAQIAVPLFELAFLSTANVMTSFAGTQAMSRHDASVLTNFFWFNRTYRQHPMGHELESIAFADKLGQRTRPIVWILMVAVIIGIAVGMLTTLQIYYSRGAASAKVNGSQVGVGWEAWNQLTRWTSNPQPPQASVITSMLLSMGIIFLLAVARNTWFGFPLHPIGYAFAVSYAMEYIWAVVLATWLIKTLVVRYGGLNLYRKSLPFFFGMILGDAVVQFAWAMVMLALGQHGSSPYLQMKW